MREDRPDAVDDYLAQLFAAVRALREAQGEEPDPDTPPVSKSEFSAHSLAALLCVVGGFSSPRDPEARYSTPGA